MLAGCSGPGHGTPRGRVGAYTLTCVSMMGKGNFLALAPVALALTAAAPAAAATMKSRRSIGFPPCALSLRFFLAVQIMAWLQERHHGWALFLRRDLAMRSSYIREQAPPGPALVSPGQKHYRPGPPPQENCRCPCLEGCCLAARLPWASRNP